MKMMADLCPGTSHKSKRPPYSSGLTLQMIAMFPSRGSIVLAMIKSDTWWATNMLWPWTFPKWEIYWCGGLSVFNIFCISTSFCFTFSPLPENVGINKKHESKKIDQRCMSSMGHRGPLMNISVPSNIGDVAMYIIMTAPLTFRPYL